MKMPESGFDKPFFMANGLADTDVPYETTALYVAALEANHQRVTFMTYPDDHSGTLIASQKDSHPFVAKLFAHQPPRSGLSNPSASMAYSSPLCQKPNRSPSSTP